MQNNDKLRRAKRWSIFALIALALGLLATQPNVASETQNQAWRHTADCIAWFFNDPDRHALECVGEDDNERPSSLVPGEPYTPPPPPNPCPSVPLQVKPAAVDTGCAETSSILAPLVLQLFGAGEPEVVNI